MWENLENTVYLSHSVHCSCEFSKFRGSLLLQIGLCSFLLSSVFILVQGHDSTTALRMLLVEMQNIYIGAHTP